MKNGKNFDGLQKLAGRGRKKLGNPHKRGNYIKYNLELQKQGLAWYAQNEKDSIWAAAVFLSGMVSPQGTFAV